MYHILTTVVMYIVITAAMRILGKRQIGELQATELVVTFLISDLAVIPLQNGDKNLTGGLIPIAVLVICEMIASWLIIKSGFFRKLICGRPIVIIRDGKVIQSALKELRITVDELFEELRQKDIFCLDDIKYAIVETDGTLSVMKKGEQETVTRKDLGIKAENDLMVTVIADGIMSKSSMKLIDVTADDIDKVLRKSKVRCEDVFILLMDSNKNTQLIRKK